MTSSRCFDTLRRAARKVGRREHGSQRPLGLFSGFVLAATLCVGGCAPGKGDVTGQVTFKGHPLSAGRISFLSDVGNKPVITAFIVRGKYTIKGCPAGPAKISIESVRPPKRDANESSTTPPKGKEFLKDFPVPQSPPELDELKSGEPVKYMPIPPKYTNPETSGLDYTVQTGPQTHDISLAP